MTSATRAATATRAPTINHRMRSSSDALLPLQVDSSVVCAVSEPGGPFRALRRSTVVGSGPRGSPTVVVVSTVMVVSTAGASVAAGRSLPSGRAGPPTRFAAQRLPTLAAATAVPRVAEPARTPTNPPAAAPSIDFRLLPDLTIELPPRLPSTLPRETAIRWTERTAAPSHDAGLSVICGRVGHRGFQPTSPGAFPFQNDAKTSAGPPIGYDSREELLLSAR